MYVADVWSIVSTGEVPEVPRTAGDVPDQAVLHVQHARHPTDGARIQPLLPQPAPPQPLRGQPPGENFLGSYSYTSKAGPGTR